MPSSHIPEHRRVQERARSMKERGGQNQSHHCHQTLSLGITGNEALCSLGGQNRFPTDPLRSFELVHLGFKLLPNNINRLVARSCSSDFFFFFFLFCPKEPDKATARSSTSTSPNLPWAQLDTAWEQPTANSSPELRCDIAAAHTFTQECLWSREMTDIFSWCYPVEKQTHKPSDSPITCLLPGGGKPHPASQKLPLG